MKSVKFAESALEATLFKIIRKKIINRGGDRPGPLLLRELTQKPRPSAADTAAPTPYAGPSAPASEIAVGGRHKVESGGSNRVLDAGRQLETTKTET
jgi:hypothetical protein